jgi:hypothetical protein
MTPADKPLPPFPDYSQPGITNNLLAERDYWESRCQLAVDALEHISGAHRYPNALGPIDVANNALASRPKDAT